MGRPRIIGAKTDDAILLQVWAPRRDAEALAELARRQGCSRAELVRFGCSIILQRARERELLPEAPGEGVNAVNENNANAKR